MLNKLDRVYTQAISKAVCFLRLEGRQRRKKRNWCLLELAERFEKLLKNWSIIGITAPSTETSATV